MQTSVPESSNSRLQQGTLYNHLRPETRKWLDGAAVSCRLTYQEFRSLAEMARDLEMWGEPSLEKLWAETEAECEGLDLPQKKARLMGLSRQRIRELREAPKAYSEGEKSLRKPVRAAYRPVLKSTGKKITGDCPVASPDTVCCNLKTIDAVENCAFGCSYCTIQTFYGEEAVFDAGFREKLEAIEIDPDRFYHFGTGQSSDSLLWGNREGILDALADFARRHPNILLEFKTKSDNIQWLMENEVPSNIVCSWSLNTETIVENEEHFTASLERRFQAARRVAGRGIKTAFHFHPMVVYEGWKTDYPALARRVQESFRPEEVLFLSFGTVTFIKPVMQQIRKKGHETRILQMELVPTAKGKLSYPEAVKVEQFRTMHGAFRDWHDKVFMYLCMEPAPVWDQVFGWHYPDNESFETDFGRKTLGRTGHFRNGPVM